MHPDDVKRAALEAARALAERLGEVPPTEVVCVRSGGVTVRVCASGVRRGRPRPGPTPCERDILAALADAREPWTTARVLSELAARCMLHGDTTVVHTLARLSREGKVRASRKAPRGYTLPPHSASA